MVNHAIIGEVVGITVASEGKGTLPSTPAIYQVEGFHYETLRHVDSHKKARTTECGTGER
ncbi:hypothetical protein GCM10010082_16130 [Kushneria pakistanensis]|uniref:Uncharacterized protein n=1 Tax=Kushneria pakistanensis TaxID=1508770 RepID=A0ABQ3FH94_9GAMM|nr:hypothetical protein [Kushneria pakistanensis]GHC24354.1 hypothetical protein GCM10010082_16130 [Kushneria pakistanensis]